MHRFGSSHINIKLIEKSRQQNWFIDITLYDSKYLCQRDLRTIMVLVLWGNFKSIRDKHRSINHVDLLEELSSNCQVLTQLYFNVLLNDSMVLKVLYRYSGKNKNFSGGMSVQNYLSHNEDVICLFTLIHSKVHYRVL